MVDLVFITQKLDPKDSNLGFVINWVDEISKQFNKIIILTLDCHMQNKWGNVVIFEFNGINFIDRYSKLLYVLISKRSEYDAIFVHMIPMWSVIASPIKMLFKKKIYLWYTHGTVNLSLKISNLIVDKIFSASYDSIKINTKKKIITGHGIPSNHFKKHELNSTSKDTKQIFKLVHVGRISPVKDIDRILEIINYLNLNNDEISVTISFIGKPINRRDVSYFQYLSKKIKRYNLESHVTFEGVILYQDLPKKLSNFDCLINLSKTNSVDKVVLEAIFLRLKIFTSNTAFSYFGYPYFVENKKISDLSKGIVKVLLIENYLDNTLYKRIVKNNSLEFLFKKIFQIIKLDKNQSFTNIG